nr:restriction endonuclease subunit S [uncultured Flavobacterium sp.]
MEKIKNLPSLRFPEFKNLWNCKVLSEIIIKLESGVSVNSTDQPVKSNTQFGILKTSCISSGKFYHNQNKTIVAEDLKRAKLNPVKDSIIISRMNTPLLVGESGYIDKDYPNLFIPDRLWMTIVDKKYTNSKLLSIILSSKNMMGKISNIATGTSGTMKNISKPNFLNLEVRIPNLPEQTKIASFLTAVDDKLQALKQKETLLEQYKKGIIQKIFSQELRFKDDNENNYPDWEEKKLNEIANKKSSNISANKIEDNFGDYIIYGASGILKKVDFYKEEDDYISIIKDGAGVGRLLYCKGQSSVLGTMEIIRPNDGIDTYYLFCLLSNIDFVKYVTGSTIPHIYFKDYSSEICGIPCVEEQTKIATFLSSIDDKINHCQEQIEKTEVWKKGVLQQMFC